MAIKVNHSTYFINPPSELTDVLNSLAYVAVLAKSLGLTDLFNQARDTYHNMNKQWEANANAQPKAKSHTDWLGGGETYFVQNTNDWDFAYKAWEIFIKSKSSYEQQILLMDALKKLNR